MTTVLMLGSAPMAARASGWPRAPFDRVLAINNAHAIRPDWDFHIHPWDFPPDRVPTPGPGQRITLRSLEAKSARLMVLAARQGCAMVNLSAGPSRLVFPRVQRALAGLARPLPFDPGLTKAAQDLERRLGYVVLWLAASRAGADRRANPG